MFFQVGGHWRKRVGRRRIRLMEGEGREEENKDVNRGSRFISKG